MNFPSSSPFSGTFFSGSRASTSSSSARRGSTPTQLAASAAIFAPLLVLAAGYTLEPQSSTRAPADLESSRQLQHATVLLHELLTKAEPGSLENLDGSPLHQAASDDVAQYAQGFGFTSFTPDLAEVTVLLSRDEEADGIDNDGDGLVDEAAIVLTRVSGADAQVVTLVEHATDLRVHRARAYRTHDGETRDYPENRLVLEITMAATVGNELPARQHRIVSLVGSKR